MVFFMVELVGRRGGLIMLWDHNVKVELVNYSQGHISVWVTNDDGNGK